jgi:signal peptidase I
MAVYFSLILVAVTSVTGIIWAMDRWVWSRRRQDKLAQAVVAAGGELPEEATAKFLSEPSWIENGKSVFPVLAFVLILRSFIYEPFQIPSGSMMPTLLIGDFILVEKFAYGLKDPVARHVLFETGKPQRGDVVVFKYPIDPRIDYIKRIVGLPGDRIVYKNKELYIQPKCDAQPCAPLSQIEENFIVSGRFRQGPYPLENYQETLGEVTHELLKNPKAPARYGRFYQQPGTAEDEFIVPAGHYFAMGDNRDNSTDSRYWGFVPEANLVGRAVAIWMSFEFDRNPESWIPSWIPTGVRFNRLGAIT